MIKFMNITVGFNKKIILHNLNCIFEKGKKYAIMGESGCGKTTILNVISGVIKPSQGSVETKTDKIAYVFQEPRLFEWLNVLENVTVVSNEQQHHAIKKASEILSFLGLENSLEQHPSELSGGMKQRVAIARAMMFDPEIILLDEPFRALDDETRQKNMQYLYSFFKEKTVIMVTHDKDDLDSFDYIANITKTPISDLVWENLTSSIF